MKLQSNLFIATTVVVLFSAGSAQANISNALQSVCSNTEGGIESTKTSIRSSTDNEKNRYHSMLTAYFNDTNCFGKRMIETNKSGLVNQANRSEPN